MKVLTDDAVSYAMQAVVPTVSAYEAGYYVRVNYASGTESWVYTSGTWEGTDEQNGRLLLYVREQDAETVADANFCSVTYYPNKQYTLGSVPKGGTFPKYYHLRVEGNTGLLRNADKNDKENIFTGWKDYYAEGTGTDILYTGKETMMVTKRTDLFAQWVGSLHIVYHAGKRTAASFRWIRTGIRKTKRLRFSGAPLPERAISSSAGVGRKGVRPRNLRREICNIP